MKDSLNALLLLLRRELGCGDFEIRPFLERADGRIEPESMELLHQPGARVAHLVLTYKDQIREDLYFSVEEEGIVCRRHTANRGAATLRLRETGLTLEGLSFDGPADRDYFYHVENPRIYGQFAIPVRLKRTSEMVQDSGFDQLAGNRWADPGVAGERIGASPYQPFPALLLSNFDAGHGLVHGTLSQQVFFHNYKTEHRRDSLCLDILGSFKAVAHLELPPGKVLQDAWYMGRTEQAADFQNQFSGYIRCLRRHLPPLWGATPINRHSLVWGSWNDGIFRDIDHDRLLRTAEFLAAHFPTVRWMQIDDGYATWATTLQKAHGLGMPYEGEAGLDKNKFPDGFKPFTDGVRERGLRPAVWIGGFVPHETPLYQERPDWFIDYSYRVKCRSPLDVSLPEVRAYMERALDLFFLESGFEGMKHDFWSYAFEDSHDLLRIKTASGYEYRDWWLKEIRKRIPADAYLQTGCDIVMANPFLGQYFTNYRYGIDIGSGKWDYVKTNFLWGTACFALQIGDLIVPNSDSVGLFPELTDAEALLCLNYCLISRSMVEISGWLYDQDPANPRFHWLKKAVCCPNNGQDVFFADFDYRASDHAPAVWYLKTPHFSLEAGSALPLRTVALFNLEDEERDIGAHFASLDLSGSTYRITDVWSGATTLEQSGIRRRIPAHGSLLLAISSPGDAPVILDSNLKVEDVQVGANRLNIRFGFNGDLELTLSRKPRQPIPEKLALHEGDGNWRVAGPVEAANPIVLLF